MWSPIPVTAPAGYFAGGSTDPQYVDPYGQLDVNASYAITKNVAVFFEGINVLGENRSGHLRSDQAINFVQKEDARYSLGARFSPSWMEHQMFHAGNLQEIEEILGRTVIVKSDYQLHQEKFDLA